MRRLLLTQQQEGEAGNAAMFTMEGMEAIRQSFVTTSYDGDGGGAGGDSGIEEDQVGIIVLQPTLYWVW